MVNNKNAYVISLYTTYHSVTIKPIKAVINLKKTGSIVKKKTRNRIHTSENVTAVKCQGRYRKELKCLKLNTLCM